MFHYYLGVDLGKKQDYTAVALLEEPLWLGDEVAWDAYKVFWNDNVQAGGWVSPSLLGPRYAHNALCVNHIYGRPANPPLHLRHLERYELGTTYVEITERIKRLLKSEPLRSRLRHTALLVDRTGPGESAIDYFRSEGLNPVAINIHGGSRVIPKPDGYGVPKRDLAFATQVLMQNKRLKIAQDMDLASVLVQELLNFRVKENTTTAHESFEHWREGDHDDLVLAVAMAGWFREYKNLEVEDRNKRQGGFKDRTFRQSDYEFIDTRFGSGSEAWQPQSLM